MPVKETDLYLLDDPPEHNPAHFGKVRTEQQKGCFFEKASKLFKGENDERTNEGNRSEALHEMG